MKLSAAPVQEELRRLRVSGVAANIPDGFIDVAIGHRQVQSAIKIHIEDMHPNPRVFLDAAPMPDAMDTSSNTPGAVARYRPIISLSKLVMATPGFPEPSKSPVSTPMPARVFPSVLKARPASTATSLNFPLCRLRYNLFGCVSLATSKSGQPS